MPIFARGSKELNSCIDVPKQPGFDSANKKKIEETNNNNNITITFLLSHALVFQTILHNILLTYYNTIILLRKRLTINIVANDICCTYTYYYTIIKKYVNVYIIEL